MKTSTKHKVKREVLRVKAYPVLCEAVEAGVAYGWNRAHKHNDKPAPDAIQEVIIDAVLTEICERFDFDEKE